MKRHIAVVALMIATSFLAFAVDFTTIDVPGASSTGATGINELGVIVGFYFVGDVFHGFVRSNNGSFTTIDVPGAFGSGAMGINPLGDIVGFYNNHVGSALHGFVRNKNGSFTTIDVPGATLTLPSGINSQGNIVGGYFVGASHSFLLSI